MKHVKLVSVNVSRCAAALDAINSHFNNLVILSVTIFSEPLLLVVFERFESMNVFNN